MAALVCDICGGKLKGRPGGIYECEFCGIEYDTEWAKAKIQEIRGTVQVEGTVQVQGSVKVEGGVNIESLLKRGHLELEDGKWDEAKKHFDEALNYDPECAEAYLGMLCIRRRSSCIEDAIKKFRASVTKNDSDFQKALRFGNAALVEKLKKLLTETEAREAAAAEEERRRKEESKRTLVAPRKRIAPAQGMLSAGRHHTVGLKLDGTVMAVGENYDGRCNVSGWKDIVAVSAGGYHTVGLKSDGTVVAAGQNNDGRCNVSDWKGIVAVSAGEKHTVGLKSDGTVVALGDNNYGQTNTQSWQGWKDIVAVSAGGWHTIGLKSDGTVVAVGSNKRGQCKVSGWKDIVAVSAGGWHTVGLKSDGTVVAAGEDCYVRNWTDVVSVSAGYDHTVVLKSDGTVDTDCIYNSYGAWDVRDWRTVVSVSAGEHYRVGLKSDGTVVALGEKHDGQTNTQGWKLFNNIASLEEEKRKKRCAPLEEERSALQSKLAALREEQARLQDEQVRLQAELPTLKGLFSGIRRREIEERLAAIPKRIESGLLAKAEIEWEIAKLEEKLKGM